MRSYYYILNAQTVGPLPLEALLKTDLTSETWVWYEGLSEWTIAQNLPELKALFVDNIADSAAKPVNTSAAEVAPAVPFSSSASSSKKMYNSDQNESAVQKPYFQTPEPNPFNGDNTSRPEAPKNRIAVAFGFHGRISRIEYLLTVVIYFAYIKLVHLLVASYFDFSLLSTDLLFVVLCIPAYWLVIAQGAKRCHDLGNSGWFQVIPLYFIALLFMKGEPENNEYVLAP